MKEPMQEVKSWIMLRVLLNRYHKGSAEVLLSGLPQEDVQNVLAQPVHSDDVMQAVLPLEERMNRIHYSWLVTPIQGMPADLQPYVLAALPRHQSESIAKILEKSDTLLSLSPPFRHFFLLTLYSSLRAEDILPASFLPESPLTPLATYSKQQLMDIFDLLGMHDIVPEVRHIVDKMRLKLLYGCLTRSQQQYLKKIMHQHDKIAAPKLGLDQWEGSGEKLEALIHRRGIIRFAKAVSGQHPDLLWHIHHTLDTGRSAVLEKTLSQEKPSEVSSALITQLVNLMNFLKPIRREQS